MRDEDRRRDGLIEAILPDVPFDGWSRATIIAGARRVGINEAEVVSLLPGGPRDAVAAFSRWADRKMLAALDQVPLEAMKVRVRVATAVRARLAALEPHREAVRRALALLALPQNMALGARLLYETVDAAWYAAGDTATDFNFYTKRGLLAGVLASTMLYWLDDRSPGAEATLGFLDRRLNDVMSIPRLGARLREAADKLPNPFRLARVARGGTRT
jgi:ubiquinone biosynthesis protein COQ9